MMKGDISMTSNLFQSIELCSAKLDNRIGVAPMTRTSGTSEGLVTDQMVS